MKKAVIFLLFICMSCTICFAQDDENVELKDKIISEIGSLVNAQKFKTALVKCDNALKKYPDEAFLYYWKGTILSSTGEKHLALENFDKSIELNSQNAKSYVMRGICKSDLGDKEGALVDFNKAIELDLKDSSAYSMRACIKLEMGDMQGANDDLELANKYMNSK